MKVKGVLPKKNQAEQLLQEAELIKSQLAKKEKPEREPAPVERPPKPAKPAKSEKRTRRRVRPAPESVTRMTVDLPSDLYDEISNEASSRFMTLKGYVMSILLARKHI